MGPDAEDVAAAEVEDGSVVAQRYFPALQTNFEPGGEAAVEVDSVERGRSEQFMPSYFPAHEKLKTWQRVCRRPRMCSMSVSRSQAGRQEGLPKICMEGKWTTSSRTSLGEIAPPEHVARIASTLRSCIILLPDRPLG